MWVKICGNTNLTDATHAATLGADAVGFVFAESPRQMDAARVASITRELPATIERIGVFGTHTPEQIAAASTQAALTGVQLHGGLDEAVLLDLSARLPPPIVLIQTLHWRLGAPDPGQESPTARLEREMGLVAALATRIGRPIRILVDSHIGQASGGTGAAFDWVAAAAVLATARPTGLPVIAAGGLRPSNVEEAISRLAPWGVDVSSGVEAYVGRKDPMLVAEFIAGARRHGAQKP